MSVWVATDFAWSAAASGLKFLAAPCCASKVKSGENKVPGFRAVQLGCFYCQKKPTRFALKENVAGDWLPDNGVS